MELIGHRGCADQYPENTVYAVRETAERLDWVEIDVRRCRSGELVVFHDETVDDLTDGTGDVGELSLTELEDLRVEGSDEGIPTLAELVEAVPAGLNVQVELKEVGLAADALAVLEPIRDRVRVTSFRPAALAEAATLAPGAERGLLFTDDPESHFRLAARLGCRTVHPPAEACAATDVVARAKERWFGVVAWRGVSESAVQQARAAGADAVTSDRWDW
jgi:glycerophosphoryl diester phosphodiesterase